MNGENSLHINKSLVLYSYCIINYFFTFIYTHIFHIFAYFLLLDSVDSAQFFVSVRTSLLSREPTVTVPNNKIILY